MHNEQNILDTEAPKTGRREELILCLMKVHTIHIPSWLYLANVKVRFRQHRLLANVTRTHTHTKAAVIHWTEAGELVILTGNGPRTFIQTATAAWEILGALFPPIHPISIPHKYVGWMLRLLLLGLVVRIPKASHGAVCVCVCMLVECEPRFRRVGG